MALEPDLLSLIRTSIRSVWALELLLLLRRKAPNALTIGELVLELRATDTLVTRFIGELESAGLVACDPVSGCRFAPASPLLKRLCDDLDEAYRERPVRIMAAIFSGPDRLKDFADAFRFKDKDE